MAFGRKSVLSQVRPLVVPSDPRTIIRKGTLGATTEAGEIVCLQSDGKWDPADASAVQLFCGVALQSGGDTDPVDVLLYGPCEVLIDATPGTAIYISDTAGEYAERPARSRTSSAMPRRRPFCLSTRSRWRWPNGVMNMTLLGNRALADNVILTGIDAALLTNYRLRDGATYQDVVNMADAALGGFNAGLGNDPFWSALISFTDQMESRYSIGNSASMVAHTEYGRPDPTRAELAGHMLPLRKWDHMLGWTADYLEEARMTDLEADIAMAIEAAQNRYRISLLQRLLKRGDDSGTTNGLSTTGLSPGFATAAANTGVDFIPAVLRRNHVH
jgi:hypothetical protein